MAELQHQYDKQDDIPEQYRELYSEKNGKWEITGISGLRTQADVERLQAALEKEKNDHKQVRQQLSSWSELGELDEVHKNLDRLPELEAAAKGKLDEASIEEIVNRRVDGVLKTRTAPLERQLRTLSKERDDLKTANDRFAQETRLRRIGDEARKAAGSSGENLLPEAVDDWLLLGERVLEVTEDDQVVTRDGVGVTPGISPRELLKEFREQGRRPHWWPMTTGTGAPGSGRGGRTPSDNPWSHEHWNMTKQGQFLREHGTEKSEALARAAGTRVGGPRPSPARK